MTDTLPKSNPGPEPCADACSGYGTQEHCPPLIVIATVAQDQEAPADVSACVASARESSKARKEEPRA